MRALFLLTFLGISWCGFGQFGNQKVIDGCHICNPEAIQIADMKNDGNKSLLISLVNNNLVQFSIDDSATTFTDKGFITENITENFITVDLDGDGDKDIVAPFQNERGIFILENRNGTFIEELLFFDEPERFIKIYSSDLDNDGNPDLIISSASAGFSWYRNLGRMNFSDRKFLTQASGNISVEIIDFDKNGFLDIIFGHYNWLTILRNDGVSFQRDTLLYTADGVEDFTAFDLNNDNYLDIGVLSSSHGRIDWYEADQSGSISSTSFLSLLDDVFRGDEINMLDIDNDGYLDILIHSFSATAWYKNLVFGGFASPVILQNEEIVSRRVATQDDLDDDGDIDMIFAYKNESRIDVALNDGFGGFTVSTIFPSPSNIPTSIFPIDLNRDGSIDVVSYDREDSLLSVYFNRDMGSSFEKKPLTRNLVHAALELVDMDKDGQLDLVAISRHDDNDTYKLSKFEYTDENEINEEILYSGEEFRAAGQLCSMDLNGDGITDVVYTSGQDIFTQKNLGNQSFEAAELLPVMSRYLGQIALGDVDNDSYPDIIYNDNMTN
ncbi:MAG: VCBS repeat-containing protein, partial [Bacteroidota bacterium]